MTIYERIDQLCSDRNSSVNALCKVLNISNGNQKTWKNDNINSEQLKCICNYLEVSADYILGRQVSTPELSDTESELLSLFRACPDADKENIILLARSFAEREQNAVKERKKSV